MASASHGVAGRITDRSASTDGDDPPRLSLRPGLLGHEEAPGLGLSLLIALILWVGTHPAAGPRGLVILARRQWLGHGRTNSASGGASPGREPGC